MDEEDMDDKEEQSEESRAVRMGQRRMMTPTQVEREEHERTHVPNRSWCRHCVAAQTSIPAHRGGKFTTAVEEDKDMKQMSKDHCFMRDQPGMEPAQILVSQDRGTRTVSAHVVPLKGAVIQWVMTQKCARDFGTLGTLWTDYPKA